MNAARALLLLAAATALAAGPLPAGAQDAPKPGSPFGDGADEPPKPLAPDEEAAARKLFAEAKALLEKKAYSQGRAKFREFLAKYPGADEDLLREAEDRGGDNCLVDIEEQHHAGPPERRIDVELMADGYTYPDGWKNFAKDALSQMKEFWADSLYDEYEDYFNVWRFDLISKEDGVDELSPEEKGVPVPPPDPRKRPKPKKAKEYRKYSTALNCVAAGPQQQVMADSEQVHRWRRYLSCSDGLTIAFAKKGQLGMGGGGIATTGKKVAVVHEFGHAFINLLDEYQGNPNRPGGKIFAANAISTDDPDPRKPPPMEEIPWKHWLLAKNKEVGVHLGGATYSTGVFRPAPGCAMNAGGGGNYCWVCREAGVLMIYSYVSPLDEYGPIQDRVTVNVGETREFWVQPMTPKRHPIQVDWFLQRTSTGPLPPPEPTFDDGTSFVRDDRAARMWQGEGARASDRRSNPLPDGNPPGSPWKSVTKKLPGGAMRSTVTLSKLDPGGWRLTARLVDDTKVPKYAFPWVIKDPDRLREEWKSWDIDVPLPAAAPAPAPPVPPKR